MPMPDQETFNKFVKADMATVTKALGEYGLNGTEDIENWVEQAEVTCRLFEMSERETLKAVIAMLRNEPRSWAMECLMANPEVDWSVFKSGLKTRFTSQKAVAENISRFFATLTAKSYSEYMSLLKDADRMLKGGCLTAEHLMKQVIARSPTELKGMLLQPAFYGCSWHEFKRYAENSAWLAFPYKIINRV